MKLKITPTESFKKDVKSLRKKNPRIAESLKELNRELVENEYGVPIGKGVYKKRVRNVDSKKGKLCTLQLFFTCYPTSTTCNTSTLIRTFLINILMCLLGNRAEARLVFDENKGHTLTF